jgi:hypothetical protein
MKGLKKVTLEIKSKQNQKENSIKRLALACINNTS